MSKTTRRVVTDLMPSLILNLIVLTIVLFAYTYILWRF